MYAEHAIHCSTVLLRLTGYKNNYSSNKKQLICKINITSLTEDLNNGTNCDTISVKRYLVRFIKKNRRTAIHYLALAHENKNNIN